MGGFVKDKLYVKKDANQPGGVATDRRPITFITSPADGDKLKAGDSIVIDANAYDREGYVTKVEFYHNSTKLSEDTTAPYTSVWNNMPVGNHDLYVRATDNNGLTKDITGCSTYSLQRRRNRFYPPRVVDGYYGDIG